MSQLQGNVVCSKCGATGDSKCPNSRTVFPDAQTDAMLSHTLKIRSQDGWFGISVKKYVDTFSESEQKYVPREESDSEALVRIFEYLTLLERNEELKGYACVHQWVHTKGTRVCDFCGQKDVR